MWELIRSNKRKSAVLIFVLAGLLMAFGYALGILADPNGAPFGLVIALGLWVILMLIAVIGGEKVLLAQSGARKIEQKDAPQLFNIVEEMKIASGLPVMPDVYLIDSPVPNAFAVGLNPKRAAVAVTTGLLAKLNRDELQGVIGHELGHISNRDTLFMTIAGITMGAIVLLADFYFRGMRFSRMRRSSSKNSGQAAIVLFVIALVFAILAPLLARLLYFACSRRREYLADACSAQFTRYPEGLASALQKIAGDQNDQLANSRVLAPMYIISPLAAAGSSRSLFSTHPSTEERIHILRSMSGDASLAAYDAAFKTLHQQKGVVGSKNMAYSKAEAIRAASAPEANAPAQQWRAARDVMNKLDGFSALACTCGLTFKIPPGYGPNAIRCPRCGTEHRLGVP